MAANKVITGVCRVSYAHLVEPYGMEGQEPKYSAVLIFPKSDLETRTAIEKAMQNSVARKLLKHLFTSSKMVMKKMIQFMRVVTTSMLNQKIDHKL